MNCFYVLGFPNIPNGFTLGHLVQDRRYKLVIAAVRVHLLTFFLHNVFEIPLRCITQTNAKIRQLKVIKDILRIHGRGVFQ
jgi:hypothetical protein